MMENWIEGTVTREKNADLSPTKRNHTMLRQPAAPQGTKVTSEKLSRREMLRSIFPRVGDRLVRGLREAKYWEHMVKESLQEQKK